MRQTQNVQVAQDRHVTRVETLQQNQAIRDWARAKGRRMADRGRIPAKILTDFEEAYRPTKRVAAATSSPTPPEPRARAPRRHREVVVARRR